MTQINDSLSPFWVRIELQPSDDRLGVATESVHLQNNPVRAYAALAGSPIEALLAGLEQFLNVFTAVEPGQLTYRVHTLGALGYPVGPDHLPERDKEVAEQKILHRSTSPRLPLKNFTAFFSFLGHPQMFSEVIQARTVTHAASAMYHSMQRMPLQIVDSEVVASLFEGDHTPVDCVGCKIFKLAGVQYSELQGIKVLSDSPSNANDGFTILEHDGPPKTRFVAHLEPELRNRLNEQAAIVALAGKQVDVLPERKSFLFHWEVIGRYETVCKELPSARES